MNRETPIFVEELRDVSVDVFHHLPVGMVITHAEGIILYANEIVLDMLDFTAEEFIGKHMSEFFHPDDMKRCMAHAERQLTGHEVDNPIEHRCLTGTGQWIWISVRAKLVRDECGVPKYFLTGMENVHARRTLEMQQSRSIEETNALLAATRTALAETDFSDAAKIIYDQCRILIGAICGYAALLSEDKQNNEMLFIEAGGLPCEVGPYAHMPVRGFRAQAYQMRKPLYRNNFVDSEFNQLLPKGHVTLNNVLFAPLVVNDEAIGLMGFAGKPGGFILRDAQIASAFADLAAIVLRRYKIQTENKKLQAAVAQSDRLSSMGKLAAGICHELNNPLSYTSYSFDSVDDDISEIKSALATLSAHQKDAPKECRAALQQINDLFHHDDINKRLQMAREGLIRIKEITASLSALSQSDVAEVTPLYLNNAVEAAINMSMYEIKYRATLVKEFESVSPILASPGRVTQCILNLLMNAAEAIIPGAVHANTITIRTYMKNNCAYLQIQDTGKGIAADDLPKLFNPIYTTKSAAGAGLGLATCKQIADELNGDIAIESVEGQGTTVTTWFPVYREKITEYVEHELNQLEPNTEHGRILVVDDEEGIRVALTRILRSHQTVDVSSGDDAIELLKHDNAFDLILCDLMMPHTSGIDLHKWLTEHIPQMAADVLFMTGGIFTSNAREYLRDIDNIIVEKPFNRKTIQSLVNTQLMKRRQRHVN